MANMFRLLRADEIDVRVGNTNIAKTKANLLLYKDARCDQNVLDEAVGPYNWMRSHSRDNANCTVSIWDEKKGQWVSKEDTGTESKTEAEKGLASDSFKRACFNWGIGRELYSAPPIWVPYDRNTYESYTVADIGYDENRNINRLAIANKSGNVIFRFGNTNAEYAPTKTEPAPDDALKPGDKIETPAFDFRTERGKWCEKNGISPQAFANIQATLVQRGAVKSLKMDEYTPIDFAALCENVKKTIPEYLAFLDAQREQVTA